MRPAAKAGLVAIGYIAALAIAFLVTRIYIGATNGPDRQTYGAMFDFGDSLLFLGVFGLAAVPPTGAALFFLRRRPAIWVALSVLCLAIASTGLIAFLSYVAPQAFGAGPHLPPGRDCDRNRLVRVRRRCMASSVSSVKPVLSTGSPGPLGATARGAAPRR